MVGVVNIFCIFEGKKKDLVPSENINLKINV